MAAKRTRDDDRDGPATRNDVEDVPEEEIIDPVSFWQAKQRELVTSVVDYNLSSLTDLIDANRINLAPKYQRRFRWDTKRQSLLIESFLMNVPVPPIFLNEDELGQYSVIDGKQRLSAIHAMLKGRLRLCGLNVFSDINGFIIDELPSDLQTVLKVRPTVRAIIILRQSDADIKFDVFKRLNTGGVRLNAQEIRNSTHPGPLNDRILELSEDPQFHKLLRVKNKQRSKIYQEMRDAEFVLRFFTFRNCWDSFSGGMMRQMDRFMSDNKRADETILNEWETSFRQSLEAVDAAFGEHAFQRWQPEKGQWRKPVIASLFDAQMFGLQGFPPDKLKHARLEIISSFQRLIGEDAFRKTVDLATNTPASFKARIKSIRAMAQTCLDSDSDA